MTKSIMFPLSLLLTFYFASADIAAAMAGDEADKLVTEAKDEQIRDSWVKMTDGDKDGLLNQDELDRVAEGIMAAYDTDHDGHLSLDEIDGLQPKNEQERLEKEAKEKLESLMQKAQEEKDAEVPCADEVQKNLKKKWKLSASLKGRMLSMFRKLALAQKLEEQAAEEDEDEEYEYYEDDVVEGASLDEVEAGSSDEVEAGSSDEVEDTNLVADAFSQDDEEVDSEPTASMAMKGQLKRARQQMLRGSGKL